MRSLLLYAHDDDNFEARLQVALDLARQCDAHLTLMQPVAFSAVMPGDFYGVMASDMAPMARAQASAFREATELRLDAEDVRWDWIDELGVAGERLLEHAALADLAIVGATPETGGRGASGLAGLLALQCRAPILVVPDSARGLALDGPMLVAWDGSLESSRALRASRPLLAQAQSVTLVCVTRADRGEERLPPLAGARYLDRHGIDCDIVELPRGDQSVADVLRRAADLREARLLVMGAYGQPRLFETIFGGVTRAMLSDPQRPLLLAH